MESENGSEAFLVNQERKDMTEDVKINPNPSLVTVGTSKRIIRKVTVLDPGKIAKLGFGERIIQAVNKLKDTPKTNNFTTPATDKHSYNTFHPRTNVPLNHKESAKQSQHVELLNKIGPKKKVLKTKLPATSSESIKSALQERIRQRYQQLKTQKHSENPTICTTSKPKLAGPKTYALKKQSNKNATRPVKSKSFTDEDLYGFSVNEISEGSTSLRRLSLALERIEKEPTNKIPSFGNLKKYLDSRKEKTIPCVKVDLTCERKKPSHIPSPVFEPVLQKIIPTTVAKPIPVSVIRRPAKDSSETVVSKPLQDTIEVKSEPVDSNLIDSQSIESKGVILSTEENFTNNSIPESTHGQYSSRVRHTSEVPAREINIKPNSTIQHLHPEPVVQAVKSSNKGIVVLDEKIFISSKPQPNNLRYPDIINYASQFKIGCAKPPMKPTNQTERTTIVKVLAHNTGSEEIQIEVVDPLLNVQSPKKTMDPIRSICKSYVRKMMKSSGIKHIKIDTPHTSNELNVEESPTKLVIPKSEPSGMHESHSQLPVINIDYSMIDPTAYQQYNVPATNSIEDVDVKPLVNSNAAGDSAKPLPGDDALDAVEFILNCAQADGVQNNSGFDDEDDFEDVDWNAVDDFEDDVEVVGPRGTDGLQNTDLGQEASIDNSRSCGIISSNNAQVQFDSEAGNLAAHQVSFSTTLHPAKVITGDISGEQNAFTFTGAEQMETQFSITGTSVKSEPLTPPKNPPPNQIELNIIPTTNDISSDAHNSGPLKKRKRTILNYANSTNSQVNEISERIKKRLLDKTKTALACTKPEIKCEPKEPLLPPVDVDANSTIATNTETADGTEDVVFTVVEIEDDGGKSAETERVIDDSKPVVGIFAMNDANISPGNDIRDDTTFAEGALEQDNLAEVKQEKIVQEQVNEFIINELPSPEKLPPTAEDPKSQKSAAVKNKRFRVKEVPILCKRSRPLSKLSDKDTKSHRDQTGELQKTNESSSSSQVTINSAPTAEKSNSVENFAPDTSELSLADKSIRNTKQLMIDTEKPKEIVAITFEDLLQDHTEEKNFKIFKTEHSSDLQVAENEETALVSPKRKEKSPRAVRVRNRHDSARNRESLIQIAESLKSNISNTDGSPQIFNIPNVASIYESSEVLGGFKKESEVPQSSTEEGSLTRENEDRIPLEFHAGHLEDRLCDSSSFISNEDDSIRTVKDKSVSTRGRKRKPKILHYEDYENPPKRNPADEPKASYFPSDVLPTAMDVGVKKKGKRGRKKKIDLQTENGNLGVTDISTPLSFNVTESIESLQCPQNSSQICDSNFQSVHTPLPCDVETPPRRKRGRPRKHPIIDSSPSVVPASPACEKEHTLDASTLLSSSQDDSIVTTKRRKKKRGPKPRPVKIRKPTIIDYYEHSNAPHSHGSEQYSLQGVDEITIENEQIGGETIEPYREEDANNTCGPTAEKNNAKNTAQAKKSRIGFGADHYVHPRLLLVASREELEQNVNDRIGEKNSAVDDSVQLPKNMVQCGACREIVPNKFFVEHVKAHYCVGWRVGLDKPINMSSYRGVLNAMLHFMKKTKVTSLKCKICGDVKKSAVGFLAHIQACLLSKEQLEKLLVKCEFCSKEVMPQALRTHVKTCRDNPDNQKATGVAVNLENDGKRKSAIKASSSFKSIMESSYKLSVDDFIKPYTEPRGNGVVLKWKNELKRTGVAACFGKTCQFQSSHMDDLRGHIKICVNIPRGGYLCTRCKYWNLQEDEVRKHVSTRHQKHLSIDGPEPDSNRDDRNEPDFIASEFDLLAEGPDEECGPTEKCRAIYAPRLARVKLRDFHDATSKILDRMHSEFVLYPEWRTQGICSQQHFDVFKPTMDNSIKFGFTPLNKLNRRVGATQPPVNWHKLVQLQTRCIEGENFIFIGGPVTRCTWIPLPNEGRPETVEYLAVTYKTSFTSHTKVVDPVEEESLILIYKIEFSDLVSSKLLYGLRCAGPINDFAFMPSGGYAPELNRLAVIIVGNVKPEINLYALPLKAIDYDCDNISVDDLSGRILDLKSNLVLCIELSESNGVHSKVQCTRLLWSEMKNHNIIAAGFSNGFVGLWDIRPDEDNLTMHRRKGQLCFVPLSYFHTVSFPISAMALHYNQDEPQWLVVTYNIREFIVYNLEDMSNPLPILKEGYQRSGISSALWPLYSENPTMAFNDDYVEDTSMAFSRSLNNVTCKVKYHIHCASGINTIAFTPWHNAIVSGCENGDILIQRFRTYSIETTICNAYPRKYIYFSDVVRLDGSPIPVVKPKDVTTKNLDAEKLTSLDSFSQDYVETHGLVFGGYVACSRDNRGDAKAVDRIVPFSLVPLTRINHVDICTNKPNLDATAIAYHNGLIRIKLMNYKNYV